MANIKEYIKKVMDGTVSLEEQQAALAQVEKTIVEAKQRRDESVGQKADMVVQALKTIEAKLEAKLVELNNTPAMQGVQGPTGKAGKDGLNGKDGRDGINGKDGVDGKDGLDGKDGISVVDAKIDFDGSLVVYLSNGAEIDCGQILSPDVAQNIIISSGGSGTSQVVTDTLISLQNQIDTLTGIDGVLGTMAQQNANAVAITGGTINGTTIGATTPSTVNATTLSGQTGVLRGTGQNFLLRSEEFENVYWTKAEASISQNSTTAPDGTNTADKVIDTTNNALHQFVRAITVNANTAQAASIYVKASEYSKVRLRFGKQNSPFTRIGIIVDLSNGSITNSDVGTPTNVVLRSATSVGNGWYRIAVGGTFDTTSTDGYFEVTLIDNSGNSTFAGTGTSGLFAWGAQLEVGSTLNTYIPTTTTAVYGTPTLSFSGVSEIGLQSNGALYLQPAGTGAIQAQQATSTTAGGNVRGANAVDWQTERGSAGQVASGSYATISGGRRGTASAGGAIVGGGWTNTASGAESAIVGGSTNTASGQWSFIGGGVAHTAAGFYNVIGGGFINAGTSGSAVTTQATTTVTNGSTAVTLSGSNANIKVGQLVTGTGIAFPSYVSAISGTSLTLNQNATASGTPTLSFFTPHGVVVGGGNNQATGSYSFIGGGGDAGTAANRNVASGDWSFVGGGRGNIASSSWSTVGGGASNGIYAGYGTIGGGLVNGVTGFGASVLGGYSNSASGSYSSVLSGVFGITRSINSLAVVASSEAIASSAGVSQSAILVLGVQTTDATATVLRSTTAAASTSNQVILPNNSAYYFRGEVISGVTGGGNTKGWYIEGVIKRGANAASTALVGTPTVTSNYADAGASTWTIAVTADTTNGGLAITFTGQAGTTIRTVAQIRTTEMTF